MAALKFGGQYAVTATATNISTALALPAANKDCEFCARLTVKNSATAANPVYLGGSDVTNAPLNAHIQLMPGQSYDFEAGVGFLAHPDQIYIVGTVNAANVVFINGMA